MAKKEHDKYIKDIAKSILLFQTAPKRSKPFPVNALALVAIGFALLLNISVFGSFTGYVIKQDAAANTIYMGFDARLSKDVYQLGERVIVQIDPVQANHSIAVIAPNKSISMLDGLVFVPQQPGKHTMSILLYLHGLTERINLQFEAR